jgi:choline monooxygenase
MSSSTASAPAIDSFKIGRDHRTAVEEASLLPTRCYTDEAFYQKEVERVFMRSWLPVGREDQLAKPGDYFTLNLFDEPVLLLKDRANQIRAFSNVCRHRAMQIAKGSGNAPAFTCPYHSWTYNLDGTLRGARFMDKTQNFVRSECRLPEFKIESWHGFLFLNFDRNAEPLGPQLRGLESVVAPLKLESRKTYEYRSRECDWNWKASLENFSEAYHHIGIHAKTAEPYWPCEKARYEDSDGPYSVFWMPTFNDRPIDGITVPAGLPERYATSTMVINIYPFFHCFVDPSMFLWLQFDVRGAQRHTLKWNLLPHPELSDAPTIEETLTHYRQAVDAIIDEDMSACVGIRNGQRSRFYDPGRMSWMEKAVFQMHNYLLSKLAD